MAGRETEQTGLEPLAAFRETLEDACGQYGLTVLGFAPEEGRSMALVGLRADAWPLLKRSAEFRDGAADPLDRWSMRVLPAIADLVDAHDVLYPFGGPPYAPFIHWAFESGETFSSPVGMLVHHRAGFWISFRGALVFGQGLPRMTPQSPCTPCAHPCETACPVGALGPGRDYDVPACKAHLASPEGAACLEGDVWCAVLALFQRNLDATLRNRRFICGRLSAFDMARAG